MKKSSIVIWLVSLFLFSGCVPTYYNWNSYYDALHNYYKNPGEREKFIKVLATIIAKGEKSNKVPPGIYAEYGYMFYETGNYVEAIKYFNKEREKYPESIFFMEKMIRNAKMSIEKAENINKVIESVPVEENKNN